MRVLYHTGCWSAKCGLSRRMLNVCIIGSGVAGLSTARRLIKKHPDVKIDILEKLPVPFGLIRYGVAPDHEGVKNCAKLLSSVLEAKNCHFLGNVAVGEDVQLWQLQRLYHAVVLAVGVQEPCKLNIPGMSLSGVHTAKDFYSWYNGLPSHKNWKFDFSGEAVAVIGHGNVALDIARVLLAPTKTLEHTDICGHAMKSLRKSCIRKVYLIGKYTPLEATFSTKEIRNMSQMSGCHFTADRWHLELTQDEISALAKPKQRLISLLSNVVSSNRLCAYSNVKEWNLQFLRTPQEIIAGPCSKKVAGIRLGIGKNNASKENVFDYSEEYEILPCNMVLTSIGFHMPHWKGLCGSSQRAFWNMAGRVRNNSGGIVQGIYCSGWAKTGPNGGLQNTMNSSYETANSILADYKQGKLAVPPDAGLRCSGLLNVISTDKVVTFTDWKHIEEIERKMAVYSRSGKPMEKITSFKHMLQIIKQIRKKQFTETQLQ